MPSGALSSITVRAARAEDDDSVLGLLQASMGWVPDEAHLAFFRWKHRDNPLGRSPAWVALDGAKIIGYRTFLRWALECGGETLSAVRAVDTATHPQYQGRGVFSMLTRHALEALGDAGVDLVFNTPNERSLPGYLKLGWSEVGRLPVSFRPRSPRSFGRLARARVPAQKWSVPARAGVPVGVAIAGLRPDDALVPGGPARAGPALELGGSSVRTVLTREHLLWRYGFPPLDYRVVQLSEGDVAEGLAIFRLRRRGPALEAAVCEVLLPPGQATAASRRLHRTLLRKILRTSHADHAIVLAAGSRPAGTIPLPGQGPTLVWKPVGSRLSRPPASWDLTMGDIELF